MHPATRTWTDASLAEALTYVQELSLSFCTSLIHLQHRLVSALTVRKPSHISPAPGAGGSYTMLVESDVRRGVRSILP